MYCRHTFLSFLIRTSLLIALCFGLTSWSVAKTKKMPKPFNFEEASRNVPKPREIWPEISKDMVPREFKILSDEVVTSDTDPSQKLRKITGHFYSIRIEGKRWGHPCVIFMPADNSRNMTPSRKGKVAIVGSPSGTSFEYHVAMYGERIAARTGYPTMVLDSPGVGEGGNRIEGNMDSLTRMRLKTGKNIYNMNCQLALIYIQAIDVMQEVLGVDKVQAVVGGHSKRGRSATVAAALDPRVAGVVILGNEGVYRTDQIQWHLSFHHAFFQDQVKVPVLYVGATNEDGYKMFSVNVLQERLKTPMTVEMIPNYRHYNFHEKQYIDFMMWVSHIFDGRPITKVGQVTHERKGERSVFRVKLEGEAKIRMVKMWYVYTDDSHWRDLMWYDGLMRKVGDHYEFYWHGSVPDAVMVEVADIAQGIPGYVTSLPTKMTDAPVLDREGTGFHHLWTPPSYYKGRRAPEKPKK
ncbi:MAG: hypothetical protein JW818_04200 [Pirellulales bacterium]|nr:hypothetical protein [Pirellulales bacterium]